MVVDTNVQLLPAYAAAVALAVAVAGGAVARAVRVPWRRLSPKRRWTRLRVAVETPSSAAICRTTGTGVGRRRLCGRDERSCSPSLPSVRDVSSSPGPIRRSCQVVITSSRRSTCQRRRDYVPARRRKNAPRASTVACPRSPREGPARGATRPVRGWRRPAGGWGLWAHGDKRGVIRTGAGVAIGSA